MADVLKSNAKPGKAWQLEGAVVTFSESNANNEINKQVIATGLEANYNRTNTPINPINRSERYLIVGTPKGVVTMSVIVGPSANMVAFLEKFSDPCEYEKNELYIKSVGTQTCKGDDQFTDKIFKLTGVMLSGVSISVVKTADSNMVMSNLSMTFVGMEAGKAEPKK
jgi:hypothetical protein